MPTRVIMLKFYGSFRALSVQARVTGLLTRTGAFSSLESSLTRLVELSVTSHVFAISRGVTAVSNGRTSVPFFKRFLDVSIRITTNLAEFLIALSFGFFFPFFSVCLKTLRIEEKTERSRMSVRPP